MKKSVFFVLIMAIAVSLSSQVIKETVPVVKPDYLQKSKRQSTIAYATGIPGCLLFSVGGIMSMSQFAAGFGGGPPYDASKVCLLYTSPSPRDRTRSRMPSSA